MLGSQRELQAIKKDLRVLEGKGVCPKNDDQKYDDKIFDTPAMSALVLVVLSGRGLYCWVHGTLLWLSKGEIVTDLTLRELVMLDCPRDRKARVGDP